VLIATVRVRLGLEVPLYTLLKIFSVAIFEKIPIKSAIWAIADDTDA